jgi:thiol-disulfide isomerase/thioredoxin
MGCAMLRKSLIAVLVLALSLVAAVGVFYLGNPAPAVAAISTADIADTSRPFIVKLHARWCPVCMLTKDEWAEIEARYADRAKLLVFDSTNSASVARSSIEAERLGLTGLWNEYQGASGLVLVLDGESRETLVSLGGLHTFDEYREAIDAVIDSADI